MTVSAFSQLQRFFYVLGSIALGTATLYFARVVLVPVVTAVLLTFILSPLVSYLQSKKLPRVLAVTLVVGLVFAILGGIFLTIFYQFNSLTVELPKHKPQILDKIQSMQTAGEGFLPEPFMELIRDISRTCAASSRRRGRCWSRGRPTPRPARCRSPWSGRPCRCSR